MQEALDKAVMVFNNANEKLKKAYEFMKKYVIEGKTLLDKFLEWIGKKVRDVVIGKSR